MVPCLNEAATIAAVVDAFRASLPGAAIHVYDNASTDGTADTARAAGAEVRSEPRRGKGNVIRRMFADVDADIYVLVDGDATYSADAAPAMIARLWSEGLDMVVGRRVATSDVAYRTGHRFGNRAISGTIRYIFGDGVTDVLSGYRVFSRRFVKSFPAMSKGFDVETEMTVHALELRLAIAEMDTDYRARPTDSSSKLHTVRDGLRIAWTIFTLLRDGRPIPFFFVSAAVLAATAIILAVPIVATFMETGLVPRFPTAILATGMVLVSVVSMACGLILDSINRGRMEMKRLHFLAVAWRERASPAAPRPPGAPSDGPAA
ncbi:MAG: glycosyltransferase [Rhodospirillaceae bacterium]|nr:glycosyltransferase [Rhodospirillaceae bacterium]